MKVNIYETIEVSDEQRVKLGALLDGKVKPKRQATRDEIKAFVWEHGGSWDGELADRYTDEFESGEVTEPDEPEDDSDLIGDAGGDDSDEDLLG